MKNDRRNFIKLSGMAGIGFAGKNLFPAGDPGFENKSEMIQAARPGESLIGPYGPWAAGQLYNDLPSLSFRRKELQNIDEWRGLAKKRLVERLAIPDIGGMPDVKKLKEYNYDGLHIEELNWQLPYGRPTAALLLKPAGAKGKLPAILAFHDHAGNKYFGTRKITKVSDEQHPLMVSHQQEYYEGSAWANEIAKRGYVVLVSDAFPFASRRVMMQDVPAQQRQGLTDDNPEAPENIRSYNNWAAQHEHVMAKSLFSAGLTWPGVFLAEDIKALDILSARDDVDKARIGCAGLSGGGMRTVFTGGFDSRIKCAVCVGFMTTWRDFILNKSFTHTWMTYVPVLPKELDFPEIFGLRAPLPSLVLNDINDQLYTYDEMKKASDILAEIYKKAGAVNNFKVTYFPGPHKFDAEMQREAFEWFDRWLKS